MTLNSTLRALLASLLAAMAGMMLQGCNDDDDNTNTWDRYKDWREENTAFFDEQKFLIENGQAYYQTVSPAWNSSAQILMRWLNDRSLTEGNLTPLLTSTVDVKYKGWLCNDVPFDSSYNLRTNGDSIFRTQLTSLISGWTIALQYMHVGDSCRIVVPYQLAYGAQSSGKILPYSTLTFDIKLVDIPYYEVRP